MKTLISLFLSLVFLPHMALADWVLTTGSYMFAPDTSEAWACQQAEMRARAEAVQQTTGETLSGQETLRCTDQGDSTDCAHNASVWTQIGGEIRKTRGKTTQTVTVPEAEGIRKCIVSFEADVHHPPGTPDPSFDLGVALSNDVFRDGDPLVITLNPSQPMIVQIFQWLPYEKGDAQVTRLFPNAFDTSSRIDTSTTIPTPARTKQYELTLNFPASLPPSRKMSDEYLMVVATRAPIAFRESYSFDDFNALISEIPLNNRRIIRRAYNIVRPLDHKAGVP